MSIHRSLAARSALKRTRNVLSRKERIDALKAAGKLNDESSIFGLQKVRTTFKTAKKKAVKKETAEGATPAAGAAAPAAGAAAKAGAKPDAKAAAPAAKPAKK